MSDSLGLRYSVSSDIVESKVGDEMVLLHLGSGTYFGLDQLGTRIWDVLKEAAPIAAICDVIATEFGVPVTQVQHDTRALLSELKDHEIISETA